MKKYVIIGASAAALSAVKTLRKLDPESFISVYSKDEAIYMRTALPKLLSGEKKLENIRFVPPSFFEVQNASWQGACTVTRVEDADHKIALENGETIPYDKLLIASGAVGFIPPIPGLSEARNAFTFRSLPDLYAVQERLKTAKRLVFIGAGLIALETAAALVGQGVDITVIEPSKRILSKQLDTFVSAEYQRHFEKAGINFALDRNVASVEVENGLAVSVSLGDGSRLPCDMIIVAAGVRPNTAFLEESSLKIERGLSVNEHMQSSDPDIYGAGDVTGLTGTWAPASLQGAIAAQNMVTPGSASFTSNPIPQNSMKFFGLPAISYGEVNPAEDASIETLIKCEGDNYLRVFAKDGLLIGALLFGSDADSGDWKSAVKRAYPDLQLPQ